MTRTGAGLLRLACDVTSLILSATVEIASVELGTIGVILLIIVLIGGALATLWAVGVALFWFGSD